MDDPACGGGECGAPAVTIAAVYTTGGQVGGAYDRDFVVLRNRGAAGYDLGGHSIQYRVASPDYWSVIALPDASIPPDGY